MHEKEGEKTKAWKVSYSFRMKDGKVMDYEDVVEAHSIMEALALVWHDILLKVDLAPKVVDYAIWNIGIMQPDVF